jgi:hypothetical protein
MNHGTRCDRGRSLFELHRDHVPTVAAAANRAVTRSGGRSRGPTSSWAGETSRSGSLRGSRYGLWDHLGGAWTYICCWGAPAVVTSLVLLALLLTRPNR